jgi:hypothetical protein
MKATNAPQFGLIPEEVAEVNPDLLVCDAKGNLPLCGPFEFPKLAHSQNDMPTVRGIGPG